MPGERKGCRELLEALERRGPDDPEPLLDCFSENEADPVPTCAAARKPCRCGHDSRGKILDCLQKFERHPSEHRAKEGRKAPAKVPRRPQEARSEERPPLQPGLNLQG